MMKHTIWIMAVGLAVLAASCGSNATKAGEADTAATAGAGASVYKVNTAGSELKWYGSKVVGVGEHYGTIALKEGSMSVENGQLTAGNFVIDMNSIQDLDMEDAEKKAMLEGHFKSNDFFNVEQYPTGKFEITGTEAKPEGEHTHLITGNLTLRDVTKSITFPARIDVNEAGLVAKGTVTINRLDWGINYDKEKMSLSEAAQQAAKNGIVSRDIRLDVNIQATR